MVASKRFADFVDHTFPTMTGKQLEVLRNGVRMSIFNNIIESPGINFTRLMRRLDMRNGVMSFHLNKLEEAEIITSRVIRGLKCYYARNMGFDIPTELDDMIVEVVLEMPGINQCNIARTLDRSHQTISYHVRRLVCKGTLKVERSGRAMNCFVHSWAV